MASQAPPPSVEPKRTRPHKPVPTERMKIERHFDILRAFASVYASTGEPVKNKAVADVVGMSETTTSLANSFFTELGFLLKAAGGLVPSPEVVSYNRTHEWDPPGAVKLLQPLLQKGWFWAVLQPKLSYKPLDEKEAVNALGAAAAASNDYRANLQVIVDYLATTGLVERDGGVLKLVRASQGGAPSAPAAAPSAPAVDLNRQETGGAVRSGFSHHPGGAVQFHINVDVSMAEIGGWSPERISAFFSGLAQVLAAKSGLEKDAAG